MTAITACTAPPGSQEWLDARQQGIGGSDIANLLGHNPYPNGTPLALWRIKMGMETDPFTGNYATKRGQHMERFLLDTYAENHPGVIIETAPDDIPSIVRHADVAAAMVSLDALAHDKDGSRVIECKTGNARQVPKWADGAIPPAYEAQVNYQLAVTGLDSAVIVADIGGEYIERHITADPEFNTRVLQLVDDWWWTHCHPDGPKKTPTPDPIRDRDTLAKLWTPDPTKDVTLPADLLARLRDTKAALAAAKTDLEIAAAEVQLAMREACTGYDDQGEIAVRWNPSKGRESIDTKALRADHPDIAAQYTRTGESGRRFTVSN